MKNKLTKNHLQMFRDKQMRINQFNSIIKVYELFLIKVNEKIIKKVYLKKENQCRMTIIQILKFPNNN